MINIRVDGFPGGYYKIPINLDEIPLRRYIEFQETVVPQQPESMRDYEQEHDDDKRQKILDQTPEHEIVLDWFRYMGRFTGFWAGMKESEWMHLHTEDASEYYKYLNLHLTEFTPDENFTSFMMKDEKGKPSEFFLPEKGMRGSTLIEYIESKQVQHLQFLAGNGTWAAVPKVIAIICRKKGEAFYEGIDEDREETMSNLPMSVVMNIVFFLMRQSWSYGNGSVFYRTNPLLESIRIANQTSASGGTEFLMPWLKGGGSPVMAQGKQPWNALAKRIYTKLCNGLASAEVK